MARATINEHPDRGRIEFDLARGVPVRAVAKKYGVNMHALYRLLKKLSPQLKAVSPPCALSEILGWRERGLYPLARGCRAPRRIMPEREATALPIPIWCYRLVAGAAEPWGQLRRRRACNTAVRGLRRVFSLKFWAGANAVFIPWRVAAARRAGSCPSVRLRRCRFLFGVIGWWPARPSHGVSFAAGGLATPR